MVTVNVPEVARPVIERVAAIPPEDFAALLKTLSDAPASLKPDKIASYVKTNLPKELPDLSDLIEIISSMAGAPRRSSVSVEEFAKGIAKTVLQRPPWEKIPKEKQTDPALLEERLVSLLNVQSIALSARASDVQHQYENVLTSARIISDIRAVFDAEQDPEKCERMGAVIVHNLQIRYFHGNEFRESFFALDNADLAMLKKVIDRAEAKTARLESIIRKAELEYYESK